MIVFWFVLCGVIGYLLGSFNGAILISRWIREEDIRSRGSGNAGLTNFYRNYGGLDTLLVLLIDVGKTVLACFIGRAILGSHAPNWREEGAMFCGGLSVIGHVFPLYFGFRGGKGILTCGTLAAFVDWRIITILLGIFILLVLITRYVSLASVIACFVYPVLFWESYPSDNKIMMTIMASCLAALACWMHRSNIKRLLAGTENKFSLHKKKS